MTFLLFLEMADEQSRQSFNKPWPVSAEFSLLLLLMMMVLVTVTLLLKLEGADWKHTTATRWKGWAGVPVCPTWSSARRAAGSAPGFKLRKQGYPECGFLHDFKPRLGDGLISCLNVTYG